MDGSSSADADVPRASRNISRSISAIPGTGMQMISGRFLSSGLTCDGARGISELLAQLRQPGCGLEGLGVVYPNQIPCSSLALLKVAFPTLSKD